MCTFRASCCSARLSCAQVLAFTGSSVWDQLCTIVSDLTSKSKPGRKEFLYLTTLLTHFIYDYMASDVW